MALFFPLHIWISVAPTKCNTPRHYSAVQIAKLFTAKTQTVIVITVVVPQSGEGPTFNSDNGLEVTSAAPRDIYESLICVSICDD